MGKKQGKWKRSFQYSQVGQLIEEELTFDKFIVGLSNGMEYFFTYKEHTIDVAFHFDKSQKIYEVNIDGYTNSPRYCYFHSIEELISCVILENKSLRELWPDLET